MADSDSLRAAGPNGSVADRTGIEEGWFDRVLAVFGLKPTEGLRESLSQALAEEDGTEGIFSVEERRLLQNILSLQDVRIIDVMIPRADIEAVPETIRLAELMKTFREAGHSRLPVYRETLDDPIGFVHAKDVMSHIAMEASREQGIDFASVDLTRELSVVSIIRPILFVPPSMPAMDLMVRMQATRSQLALVVDEYGGTDGLVSLEDLIETVVGDIQDEYDWEEDPTIERGEHGVWLADARVELEAFEREVGLELPDVPILDEVDTLGGVVFAILGRVPVRGEIVRAEELPQLEFEVLDADPRRIKRVKVRVTDVESQTPHPSDSPEAS